jgi:hypothetical protein
MNKYKNLIGYGSYGYIFHPPIDLNINELKLDENSQYIVKLLLNTDGDNEINNQTLISKIDKNNEYHLGNYYKINTIPNSIDINDFSLFNSYNISELCLIVQKYGGIDLCCVFKNKIIYNFEDYKLFLIEIYRMIEGIKIFNQNNLIHHDINPKNLVYDKKNNRLNFIDFSLTTTKEKIINDTNYEFAIFHSSFPIESGFYNKKIYENIMLWDELSINSYCDNIKKEISHKINKNDTKIVRALKDLFFFYYVLDNKKTSKDVKYEAINNLNLFLLNIKKNSFDDFIKKSLDTFDLYGYGLCLLYSLRFSEIYLSDNLTEELYDLALKILDLNVFTRLSIEKAQNKFKNILIKHNILNL